MNYSAIFFLSIFFSICSVKSYSQTDSLYIENGFIGTYNIVYIQNGQKIEGQKAIMNQMESNNEAFKYIKRSARSVTTGKIIYWVGAATALSFLAVNENNPEIGSKLLFGGFSAMVLSTSFYFLSKKQAKKSVTIYNQKPYLKNKQSHIQLGINANGVGLAFYF